MLVHNIQVPARFSLQSPAFGSPGIEASQKVPGVGGAYPPNLLVGFVPSTVVAVGAPLATVPFEEIPDKPVLLLLGAEDLAVTTETTLGVYDLLAFEKRYASVDGAGHNSFTDQCEVLFEGNDIIAAAQFIFGDAFPDSLVALARDGCEPDNLAPSVFWEVAQHFTVAHVRKAFSLNSEPRGLTAGAAGLFEDITVDYRFEEP